MIRLIAIAVVLVAAYFLVRGALDTSRRDSRISRERAHELVSKGARLVDVRTPAEYRARHLPGALNVPLGELARRASELGSPETPLVLYCRSGRRSELAAAALRQRGFEFVYDLGPMSAW